MNRTGLDPTINACPRCPARAGEPCIDRSGRPHAIHASRARLVAPDPYLTDDGPPVKLPAKMMNRHPFRCPRCGRWSPELSTHVVRDRGEWIHAACAVNERAASIRHHLLASSDPDRCATCGGHLHPGNRTVNRDGDVVHAHGCPRKRRRTPLG